MTFAAFRPRGLDSLHHIIEAAPSGRYAVPDFICPDVLDLLHKTLAPGQIELYRVRPNLSDDLPGRLKISPMVTYTVDYFGYEAAVVHTTRYTIRDAVWMPAPIRPVEPGQFWFNSFRKFAWPANGSLLLAGDDRALYGEGSVNVRVGDLAQGILAGSAMEQRKRRVNFQVLMRLLGPWMPRHMEMPEFVSVFPVICSGKINRGEVCEAATRAGHTLPGMWENRYGIANHLYDTLQIIPCDSRFDPSQMMRLGEVLRQVIQPPPQELTDAHPGQGQGHKDRAN